MPKDPIGTIYVPAAAGSALRVGNTDLLATDVLGITGNFSAGDVVHVVTRSTDGGQRVLGSGPARVSAEVMARLLATADPLASGRSAVVMFAGAFMAK